MTNPWRYCWITSRILARYRGEDGSLFGESEGRVRFEAGRRACFYDGGLGWGTAGKWPLGKYHVDIFIDGECRRSGEFAMVDDVAVEPRWYRNPLLGLRYRESS